MNDADSILAGLLALGVPTLILALAASFRIVSKGFADSRVKTADAEIVSAAAKKLVAEADVIRATAARAHEETTGRLVDGVRKDFEEARHDLDRCEEIRAALAAEIAVEREAREGLSRSCQEKERTCTECIAELRARVSDLERRSSRPQGGE